jgi:hypothetical protein
MTRRRAEPRSGENEGYSPFGQIAMIEGRPAEARAHLTAALTLFTQLKMDAEAAGIQAPLKKLPPPPGTPPRPTVPDQTCADPPRPTPTEHASAHIPATLNRHLLALPLASTHQNH